MEITLSPVQLRAFARITWKRRAKNFDSAEDMLIAHFRDKGKNLLIKGLTFD
jgi:hypothetical protein